MAVIAVPEPRRIVDALRRECAHGIVLVDVVASLEMVEREILRKLLRAARERRAAREQAAEASAEAEDRLTTAGGNTRTPWSE